MEQEEFYTVEELMGLWQYHKKGPINDDKGEPFRFFWVPEGERSYEFICAQWAMSDGSGDNARYSMIAQGWVCFDGVRHIWFGYQKDSTMNGYDNYPHIDSYIAMFQKIKEINTSLGIEND